MSSNVVWVQIDGAELFDARDEGRLKDLVPNVAGLYVWRRKLVAPTSCKSSSQDFRNWVLELAEQANARLGRRALSHCVWSEGIQVGGGGLTENKVQTLDAIAANSKLRRLVISYIESLSDFHPAIYIGEADNLCKRVKEHIDGETGLHQYADKFLELKWEDLRFCYFKTSKTPGVSTHAKSIQELLEMIAQRALAPFATNRPG
jgi:hypothetical protein